MRVDAMYAGYLGREPDAGGLAFWKRIDLGSGDSVARQGILSSTEYWHRNPARFLVIPGFHG